MPRLKLLNTNNCLLPIFAHVNLEGQSTKQSIMKNLLFSILLVNSITAFAKPKGRGKIDPDAKKNTGWRKCEI